MRVSDGIEARGIENRIRIFINWQKIDWETSSWSARKMGFISRSSKERAVQSLNVSFAFDQEISPGTPGDH
jgi:hypothetical protein